jgi:hypothetical protein
VQVLSLQKKKHDFSYIDLAKSKYLHEFLGITTSEGTRKAFKDRLTKFSAFVLEKYHRELDELLLLVRDNAPNGKPIDPAFDQYTLLSGFVSWLIRESYNPRSIKNILNTTKQFLQFKDIEFVDSKLKAKVKMPRVEEIVRQPLSLDLARQILLDAQYMKLRTFLAFLDGMACRPIEGCAVRFCDLDLDSKEPSVNFQAKYTKMRRGRKVRINRWLVEQLRIWIAYRNRSRYRIIGKDPATGKLIREWYTPKIGPQERVFALHHPHRLDIKPSSIYMSMHSEFTDLRHRMGIDKLDETGYRMEITFYSFRKMVKTMISNLGYSDFSEYFIGHRTSTYWNASDEEKNKVFEKLEPHFAILDWNSVEERAESAEMKAVRLERELKDAHRLLGLNGDLTKRLDRIDAELREMKG